MSKPCLPYPKLAEGGQKFNVGPRCIENLEVVHREQMSDLMTMAWFEKLNIGKYNLVLITLHLVHLSPKVF